MHIYPSEVSAVPADYGPQWVERMNSIWGYIVKQKIAPVFVGECGDAMVTPDAKAWAAAFVSYINGHTPGGPVFAPGEAAISWCWWVWGTSEAPGEVPDFGVMTAWTNGSMKPEQAAVLKQLMHHPAHD